MIDNSSLYYYKAVVTRVVDGDTCWVQIDQGFRSSRTEILRLADLNCPETHTGKPGLDASAYTSSRLLNKEVLIKTIKTDSFGRYLAKIWIEGTYFNQELIDKGYAIPYLVDKSGV